MSITDLAASFGDQLDAQAPDLAVLDSYLEGQQPAAFLSPESRKALGDRLHALSINFPRLVVASVAERLNLEGFRTEDPAIGADLWRVMKRRRMLDGAASVHFEALALGRAYVIVWAGRTPETPLVTVESARQVTVQRDPATGEVTAAAKRWIDGDRARMTLYLPDRVVRLQSKEKINPGSATPNEWVELETLDNPLGVVPVVPFINRGRLLDTMGRSEMVDVLSLSDALNKLASDAMVSSEFYARPRRWATGLEIMEDEDGNPINPFADGPDRVWQSESPETSYGQFEQASMSPYSDLMATITQQIGALTGLPPHYLGLNGDQPASADAIRSAEASLVSTARARIRTFGDSWADVARLVYAVQHGVDPETLEVEAVWGDPETRTPAQSADAATKLRSMGVALDTVLDVTLGWTPEQREQDRRARRAESLDASLTDLSAIVPTPRPAPAAETPAEDAA